MTNADFALLQASLLSSVMMTNEQCKFCILASKHAVMHLAQLNYMRVAMTRFVSQQLRSSPEEEEADP